MNTPTPTSPRPTTDGALARYPFAAARILLGWLFLWAFLDKTFGLGHATERKNAWIDGGSPTQGFLKFGTKGPLSDFYHSIAGAAFTDWLFMITILALGVSLMAGIGLRVAAVAGGILVVMMWSVVLPPTNNILVDDHLIYLALLLGLALSDAGRTWGLGGWWSGTALVRRAPWLR
ncbi:MAG: DoxX family membrane protein [Dactylosporangium sp.]|nr:DoxX family membrane protein [Dactylosporangium sp.]